MKSMVRPQFVWSGGGIMKGNSETPTKNEKVKKKLVEIYRKNNNQDNTCEHHDELHYSR